MVTPVVMIATIITKFQTTASGGPCED
jgi:hypothetical protein